MNIDRRKSVIALVLLSWLAAVPHILIGSLWLRGRSEDPAIARYRGVCRAEADVLRKGADDIEAYWHANHLDPARRSPMMRDLPRTIEGMRRRAERLRRIGAGDIAGAAVVERDRMFAENQDAVHLREALEKWRRPTVVEAQKSQQ